MSMNQKRLFYSVSFVMPFAQMACFIFLLNRNAGAGSIDFRHLAQIWLATALIGIASAVIAGGGIGKRTTGLVEFCGVALNGVPLAILGLIYLASFVHD